MKWHNYYDKNAISLEVLAVILIIGTEKSTNWEIKLNGEK